MLGANYTRMNEKQRKMMGVDNPVGVTAGFTIPLWVPKYQARIQEAGEMEKAAQADEEAQRLKVRADLAKAYFSLTNSAAPGAALPRDAAPPGAPGAAVGGGTLPQGRRQPGRRCSKPPPRSTTSNSPACAPPPTSTRTWRGWSGSWEPPYNSSPPRPCLTATRPRNHRRLSRDRGENRVRSNRSARRSAPRGEYRIAGGNAPGGEAR